MKQSISILAPGVMGASLAKRLVDNGLDVRTNVVGRSDASIERARDAGMTLVDEPTCVSSHVILSVVPPKEAIALAKRVSLLAKSTGSHPIYVDCNAINPETVQVIEDILENAGCKFVDASIIGAPASPGYAGPAIFASGPEASQLTFLSQFGIQLRVMNKPTGAASALKMSYGGLTKGLIAIGSAMILGAQAHGIADALFEEMSRSQGSLLNAFSKSIPDMFSKADRWVAEMEEISGYLDASSPQGEAYKAFASFYEFLAKPSNQSAIEQLDDFFRMKKS